MKLHECVYMNNKRLIENEVSRLIEAPIEELIPLLSYEETKLYFVIIVESKIKLYKRNNYSLQPIIQLITNLRFENEILNNKLAHVWALLALFEWPDIQINFLNDWFGMLILEKFLFLILYGTEIDSKRQHELIGTFANIDLEGIYEKLQICPGIAMGVLKHISVIRNVDHKRISSLGFTSDDFDEIIYNMMDNNKEVLIYLKDRRPDPRIISKLKGNECSEYAIRGLKDPRSFEASVYYLKNHSFVLNTPDILIESIEILAKAYPEQDEHIKNEIKALLSIYCKKYPEIIPVLLKSTYCKDVSKIFVTKSKNLYDIISSDPYVMCYVYYELENKMECLKYLYGADEKLMINILDRFKFTKEELDLFKSDSEEIIVKKEIKLNIGCNWNGNLKRYYYIVKNLIFTDVQLFYEFYLQTTEFEYVFKIFGILFKHMDVPDEILKKIYVDLDSVNVKQFKEFITDCLPNIKYCESFIEKIHPRVIEEWNGEEDMSLTTRKYMELLDKLGQINRIVDLILIEDTQIIRKAITILNFKNYNPEVLVSNLLRAYQSPLLIDVQPNIINLLIQAIGKSTSDELTEVRSKLHGENKKKQKNILKEYVKEIRGMPLNNLFSIPKVTAKGIFKKKSNNNENNDNGESISGFFDELK